jgi:hypothetical protein
VTILQHGREPRRNRYGGGPGTDQQMALRIVGTTVQILLQHLMLAQNAPRAGENAFALNGEAGEVSAALDDRRFEVLFERSKCVGQSRLCNAGRQRGLTEVPMIVESDQIFEENKQVHGAAPVPASRERRMNSRQKV